MQNRRAIMAEDPCKLMAYVEHLIGTHAIATQLAEMSQRQSEYNSEIHGLESRLER